MVYKFSYSFNAAVKPSFRWHVILIDVIVIELIVAKVAQYMPHAARFQEVLHSF